MLTMKRGPQTKDSGFTRKRVVCISEGQEWAHFTCVPSEDITKPKAKEIWYTEIGGCKQTQAEFQRCYPMILYFTGPLVAFLMPVGSWACIYYFLSSDVVKMWQFRMSARDD